MWTVLDEHMTLITNLNLVCKDMKMDTSLSILGGDDEMDLNARSRAIRISSNMWNVDSGSLHWDPQWRLKAALGDEDYITHLQEFEAGCLEVDRPVTFAALKMLFEEIAVYMVKKGDKFRDLMGADVFCQHDKLIELIQWDKHKDLEFPAYGITPENYTHFCYFSLNSIYGQRPDGTTVCKGLGVKSPWHEKGGLDASLQAVPASKSIQGIHYDKDRFSGRGLDHRFKDLLFLQPHCGHCRQMAWGAECAVCRVQVVV